jgi:excisionase family DNA binding protein|tara:strand:- start:2675 stop:2875 length:201 start_codon:yes stop_codon:yes gene_type:complete
MSAEKELIADIVKEVLINHNYMSVKECAEKLNLTVRTVRSLIVKKEIFAKQLGNKFRIPEIQFFNK